MANDFYNRGASFNPDELADGDAIEAEFDAVSRGFDTIEELVNANRAGYPTQTFHVAPAELDTHAVPKAQMDAALSFKLDTVNYNASDILTKLKTVDGASSGLDADYLDGQHGSYYRNASNINAGTLAKERLPANIDANTSGNANTATNATDHIGDQGLVHGATSLNNPGKLMARDVNGDVAARYFVGNLVGTAQTADSAAGWHFSATSAPGGEAQLAVNVPGYAEAYLFSNPGGWGAYSADGGMAFSYSRSAGKFSFNGNAETANIAKQVNDVTVGDWGGADLVYGRMATDDYFRIRIYSEGYDQGKVEIATADGGNEPIYVRQYSGGFASVVRTLSLLDANGNTVLPGRLYSYGGVEVSGNSGGIFSGGDAADAVNANIKIASWQGIGFSPTGDFGVLPAWQNSHWFNTRNGDTSCRGYVYAGNGRLKDVAVLSGEIGHGGTLPIPSGFSADQCKFFVSPRDTGSSGYKWDLREGISAEHYRIICYQSGRVALGYTLIYNDVNDSYESHGFTMSYIVIGVK